MRYTGRFAPSPTGPLHFGSLLAAVGSYCDARAAGGRWLVRMEDTDPPRAMPGASDLILRQLEAYALEWDGTVLYQSQRRDAYEAALARLQAQGDLFWCRCSRATLAELGTGAYPGTCRAFTTPRADAAIRLRVPPGVICFEDAVFGPRAEDVAGTVGDFVLRRRDGLYSYQLAVVVDDAEQGVSRVVRGADLLDNTARQIMLQQRLNLPAPGYLHLPLAVHADGSKLSKQTYATALPLPAQPALLRFALERLGQVLPPAGEQMDCATLLAWGVSHWRPDYIRGAARVAPGEER